MDPLSVTASLIAVSGALATSVKALQKVVSLRHAPSELLSLQNEVKSLQSFLRIVNEAFRDSEDFQLPSETIEGLEAIKSTLEGYTQELHDISHNELKRSEIPNKNGTPKVARIAWMRLGNDVACLQRKIRDSRVDLQALLSILSLQSNIRVLSVIENVSLQIQASRSTKDSRLSESDSRRLQSIDDLVRSITRSTIEPNVNPNTSSPALSNDQLRATESSDGLRITPKIYHTEMHNESVGNGQRSQDADPRILGDYTLQIATRGVISTCARPCPCSCHSRHFFQTPRLIQQIFGTLLYSYTGPVSFRRNTCNYPRCKSQGSRSFRVTYMFPPWLLERAISFSANYIPLLGYGALCSLRVPRFLDGSAQVWRYFWRQQIVDLELLIKRGSYSVYDMGKNGNTLLHVRHLLPLPQALIVSNT